MKNANSVLESCDSTNRLAKQLAEQGCAHGTWVSARSQTDGRGRLGRKWDSLEGNLFLSIIVRDLEKKYLTWIPLATAVSVARFLNRVYPAIPIQIKWPNDIYLMGEKVGGILCEGTLKGVSSYVIIGLGLNCVRSPQGLNQPATNLSDWGGFEMSPDSIRKGIIAEILSEITSLAVQGPDGVRSAYKEWAFLKTGDEVTWGGSSKKARVLGLGPEGNLEVIHSEGMTLQLYAEDVSLVRKANDGFHL